MKRIEFKINDLSEASVFFVIVALISLRPWGIIMQGAQVFFLFGMLLAVINQKKIQINKYLLSSWLFTLFAIISITWAKDAQAATAALKPLIQVIAIGAILSHYIQRPEQIDQLIHYILIASMVLVVVLLVRTPVSEWLNAMIETFNASTSENRIGPSIDYQPNGLGVVASFCILLWIYEWSLTQKKKKQTMMMIGLLLLILLFTKSRKAIVALVLGPAIYWLLYKDRQWNPILTALIIVLGVLLFVWAIFTIPFLYRMIGFRMIGFFNLFNQSIEVDASIRERGEMMRIGWELFTRHPIRGVGFGNFSHYYYYEFAGWAKTYAHNNYVEILADTGIIGFMLYYFVPFWMFIKTITHWESLCQINRKLTALILSFIIVRLLMDYGMVLYDDEFLQFLTVILYCALEILIVQAERVRRPVLVQGVRHGI